MTCSCGAVLSLVSLGPWFDLSCIALVLTTARGAIMLPGRNQGQREGEGGIREREPRQERREKGGDCPVRSIYRENSGKILNNL